MFGKKVTTMEALMPGLNKMAADIKALERARDEQIRCNTHHMLRIEELEKALEEQANDHRRHEHYMYEDGGVGLPMYPAKSSPPSEGYICRTCGSYIRKRGLCLHLDRMVDADFYCRDWKERK